MSPEKELILISFKLFKNMEFAFLEKLSWRSAVKASAFFSYLGALCLLAAGEYSQL